MLYITNILRYPYTGSLESSLDTPVKFDKDFIPNQTYKWIFNRALNETPQGSIIDFDKDKQIIMFNGLFENIDKKYLKFEFDFRVRFSNNIDVSLCKSKVTSTSVHNIINKRLKLIDCQMDKFIFQPYRDMIYITMNVKNNLDKEDKNPIKLKLETLGFDLLSTPLTK